ncbi:hypothetical protein ACW9HL_26480, partial [Nocardia gipuzkoensis]
ATNPTPLQQHPPPHQQATEPTAVAVLSLHKLARLMADDRAVFEAMDAPAWLAPALASRDEDFEWDDDDDPNS